MRVGLDIGGSKIEVAALTPSGNVIFRDRRVTPRGSYDAVLTEIDALIRHAETQTGARFAEIGICTPGSLSPATGLMRNAYSTCLNGRPLDRDLAALLGRPVRLANDANCFALAEARAGAGQGYRTLFAVIIGTGVGAGIVVEGQLLAGRNAIAGEWGHNPLAIPGIQPAAPCDCGREACVEAWCSGPALAADHAREVGATGAPLDAAEIVARAGDGDNAALATLARHCDRLGRALAGVVNILDPDAIVLGGGLSNIASLYCDLPVAMAPHIFSDIVATPVLRNALGDSAGVVGAAYLGSDDVLYGRSA